MTTADYRYVKPDGSAKQVGIEEIDFFGRFGAKASSNTAFTIEVGEQQFTCNDAAAKFEVGDELQGRAVGFNSYCYGVLVGKDVSSGAAVCTIAVNDISQDTGTYNDMEWQVTARPKAWLEVDISLTGIDPTSAGPFIMDVTAGKLFNFPQGTVLLRSIAKREVAVLCRLFNYNGTELRLEKIGTNATVSEVLDEWDVALIDAPPAGIPMSVKNGLRVSIVGTTLTVTDGSIRSSDDTHDLILKQTITKDLTAPFAKGDGNGALVLTANLAGTVTTTALPPDMLIDGTGTAFLSEILGVSDDFGFADYIARGGAQLQHNSTVITVAGITDAVATNSFTGTPTQIIGIQNVTVVANKTYQRGGWATDDFAAYGITLIREDATGDVDVSVFSLSPHAEPDLPAGWTPYGAVAVFVFSAFVSGGLQISQWSGTTLDQISPLNSDGQMLVYDGGNVPLEPGDDGDVLKIVSGKPEWSPGSGWELVGSGSFPTNANSLSVTGITKDDVLIYFTGVKCATTTRFLSVQPNGDTTVADYLGTGGTVVASIFNPLGTTQTNAQTTTGRIEISGAQQAVGKLCSSAGKVAASTMVSNNILWDVATVISSLTFNFSTGNFSGGTWMIFQR